MKKLMIRQSLATFLFTCLITTVANAAPFKYYSRIEGNGGPSGYDYVKKAHVEVYPWEFTDIICRNPGFASCPSTIAPNDDLSVLDECEYLYTNSMVQQIDGLITNGTSSGNQNFHYFNVSTQTNYYYTVNWFLNSAGEQVTEIYKEI